MPLNLEEKLKKVINDNYVKIINTLDPKTFLTHLKVTGILTVGGYDPYYEELNNMLTHGKPKQDINIRLLEILYTRDRWWIAFFKALHQCGLQKIIDILEGALSEKEVYQLHRERGKGCRPRSNGRPPRSERTVVYMRHRPPSDTDSDLGSQTENAQYHSRSRRKTSREVDQELTQLNSPRQVRSDCYAAPDPIHSNEISWTQESHGYEPNGYLQHPEEQDDRSDLHPQPHYQPFPSEPRAAQTQTSMHYENGSSHKDRGSTQSNPGYIHAPGTTGLARSSSAPAGHQHSEEWHSSPRQSHNPSNAFRGSRQSGQGQVASGQFSPADPVITSPSVLSDQATRQDRAIEGGPRTSGPTQTFGPQSDRPTSCNDCSSLAPWSRQEQIHVNFNTPLRKVPMKLLTLLYKLDHNQKWSDLGSILTDKFLSEDHNKILTSYSEEPKTKQVLDFFKEADGDRATLGRLMTALQKMQRQDLLDDIKELTGLTFQDEEDVINEHTRNNSWAGASSNMVDLDIPTPDNKPPNASSAARADAIDRFEQSSISSSTLPVTDPNKCRDEAKPSCIRTTEGEVSHSSFTGTRSDMYTSKQIILSQLEEEKKLDEALKCENPNEEHPTEQEHGNPPCLESHSSDENNPLQNSLDNAEGGATKMENAENQDTKPKPELRSKVINTSSSDGLNRDTVASTNQQPKRFTSPAAASNSPLPSSINTTGTEADVCQHGEARIYYPPQLPVHAKDQGSPTSEKLSTSFDASETVSPGQLPNFDKIQPVSLQSSGRSNTSQSIHGLSVAASNNPNHLLGPDSGVTTGTVPMVGDKTSPNNYVAHQETMPKTLADSSDDRIAFTENGNTAPKLFSGQHSSSVEATTPHNPTGATGSLGPDLNVTSDGSVCFVGTLGSSILDNTQRSTYQNSEDIGERHKLTMSESSVTPSFIAKYENKVLQQSIYYERMPDIKGCVEDDFVSLGESVEEEEEKGELASGHTEVKDKSYQGQGECHSGAEGSRSINGGVKVPDGTATADSRSIAPAADGTGVTSSPASPPLKGASASSATGCTSSSADGDTSSGHAGTSANANRGTSFSSVISSGLKLFKLLTIATDVNKFYST